MVIDKDFDKSIRSQFKIIKLQKEIDDFKSGEKYTKLAEEKNILYNRFTREINKHNRKYKKLENKVKQSEKSWNKKYKDLENYQKEVNLNKDSIISSLQNRLNKAKEENKLLKEKLSEKNEQVKKIKKENEEYKQKIEKLQIQIEKDFLNSSLPSSMQGPKRIKIPNTRKKTDKKPGAQKGHEHHPRRKPVPQRIVNISDPEEFFENPDMYKTKKTISKILISAKIKVDVVEYKANIWRKRSTGARLHAPFPHGVIDDVNYDGSVKALAFMLNNECCVSIKNTRTFLDEASENNLKISDGMISQLRNEFSKKSNIEKLNAINKMMSSRSLHADFTNSNVNGENKQVLILHGNNYCYLFGREKKGHQGIKNTPLQNYAGCIIHDHDTTFYSYGLRHQECMQHNIRYLTGAEQNETHLTWHKKMKSLLRDMIHWRNENAQNCINTEKPINKFIKDYDDILELARFEYQKSPPNKYYRDGYNLYLRLGKYKDSQLHFLFDFRIKPENSVCERLARKFKRKLHQATVFRDYNYFCFTCEAIAIINNLRTNDKNVYSEITNIFNRKLPT